ncbi:WRKY DNA-binding transcription factor 70-like [Impatiens glandulifera]|uniref:WRKY DNA-binding transcription factor 70-like n=1 Tax=Impatiens glandulifera TaxID=253017 RepID=UPI001FB115B9|nr:WRKY DNA-binding transcription factor 70-like [Impatiens glandulifera]
MDHHSPWVEKATAKLIKGRENLIQLMKLLEEPSNIISDISVSAEDLVTGISRSFDHAIHILSSGAGDQSGGGISDGTLDKRSVDSVEISKRPAAKNKRGCYKRRKNSESWNLSPTMEDGYAWRKYGQKFIHTHNFPRGYFRCTYKKDGCKATKQVNKWEEDPSLYRTTYFGRHTCSNKTISSQQSIPTDDPYNVNFDSITTPTSEVMDHPLEDKSNVNKEGDNKAPEVIDGMLWSDLTTFDQSSEIMFKVGFEDEDVSSIYNLFDYEGLSSSFGVDIDANDTLS